AARPADPRDVAGRGPAHAWRHADAAGLQPGLHVDLRAAGRGGREDLALVALHALVVRAADGPPIGLQRDDEADLSGLAGGDRDRRRRLLRLRAQAGMPHARLVGAGRELADAALAVLRGLHAVGRGQHVDV